jgi:hypothetical protein
MLVKMLKKKKEEEKENGCTIKTNLQIQGDSHQNPNVILYRNRKKSILNFIWKHKRP